MKESLWLVATLLIPGIRVAATAHGNSHFFAFYTEKSQTLEVDLPFRFWCCRGVVLEEEEAPKDAGYPCRPLLLLVVDGWQGTWKPFQYIRSFLCAIADRRAHHHQPRDL